MIKEQEIVKLTHYGLNIYAHILREYYPGETVVQLSGSKCKPVKNPFNEDKLSLNLVNEDGVFIYSDSELPEFSGNPFDFAERYYKISGSELLEKLNSELNLRIGQQHFYSNRHFPEQKKAETKTVDEIHVPQFSFFKAPVSNIYPKITLSLLDAFNLLKSEDYASITNQLRAITNKDEARKYKATKFDYVTFSGTFEKRNDKALQKHSGLLTIDFDHIPNIQQLKQQLLDDEYFETELMFVSPSGDGLKWVITIDFLEAPHQEYFKAVAAYIFSTYQIEVDNSGKDISRACFLPFDPEVYINPNYLNTTKFKNHETK